MKDQVFTVAQGEFQVMLNAQVLPHIWNTRGAALAGLATERRRAERERLNDLWATGRATKAQILRCTELDRG